MAKVKLSDSIRHNGNITTCAELLNNGIAGVRMAEKFYSKRAKKGYTTKYFCDLIDVDNPDNMTGWEIGRMAYESRVDKGQEFSIAFENAKQEQDVPAYTGMAPCNSWVIDQDGTEGICDGVIDSSGFCIFCNKDYNG